MDTVLKQQVRFVSVKAALIVSRDSKILVTGVRGQEGSHGRGSRVRGGGPRRQNVHDYTRPSRLRRARPDKMINSRHGIWVLFPRLNTESVLLTSEGPFCGGGTQADLQRLCFIFTRAHEARQETRPVYPAHLALRAVTSVACLKRNSEVEVRTSCGKYILGTVCAQCMQTEEH